MHDPEFEPPAKGKDPSPRPDGPADRAFAWLRRHERGVVVAAVGLQLLVLGEMIAANTIPWAGRSTSTVLLRVVPVDPRDLMRGDYVTLGYDISRVPPGGVRGLAGPTRSSRGETVYVALVPEADGRHYRGDSVSTTPPASGRFIRGTLTEWGGVVFGIESYYVQEGKGHDYEAAVLQRRLSAEVALAPDGRASLRGLVFD
jgi:uncharacterized membrane-anchored protein